MTRNELITSLKKYFKIKELVCPHCLSKFGDTSWQFLSTELLSTLYVLRTKVLKEPVLVNHSNLTQRGLRCNLCSLVKTKKNIYLSAHVLGKAVDFTVPGKTADQVRQIIKDNIDEFEYPIRLEEGCSWVHIDCYTLDSDTKLTTFSC